MANRTSLNTGHYMAPLNSINGRFYRRNTDVILGRMLRRMPSSEINNTTGKGFPGITGTAIFNRAHSRHRNEPDLYFCTVDGALASEWRSIRPITMSLKEESDNEVA